jgi:hypothetical protein
MFEILARELSSPSSINTFLGSYTACPVIRSGRPLQMRGTLPLGFDFYTYSNEKYELSVYPNGQFIGTRSPKPM